MATLYYHRREVSAVQTLADTLLTQAAAQGFPQHVAYGTYWRGWVRISARISCNVLKLSGILHGLTMSSSPIGDPDHAVAPHRC
jgi:hypothetical protein